jgi:hypothetical protein
MNIAIAPTITFNVAATTIVDFTPNVGSKKKPAIRVPKIAPTRLHAYNLVTEFASRFGERSNAAERTGKVAPIKLVGTSSSAEDKTNRHKLKTKKPG